MPDRTPVFNPPLNHLIDNDPQIVKVAMEKTDFGFRKSAIPQDGIKSSFPVRNIPNMKA